MKKLLLLSLIGLNACQEPVCEKGIDQTTGLAIRVLDRQYFAYDQEQGEDLTRNGLMISSRDQYENVFSQCCGNRLENIDFTQYDLLGLTTVNRGSNSHYIRDVKRDDTNKKITYTVSEAYCTRSSPVEGHSNFVVVPKIPAGYQVDYVRNQ